MPEHKDQTIPNPRLTTLLYSPVDSNSLENSLGLPEYSYAFVFKQFKDVISTFSEIMIVNDLNNELTQKIDNLKNLNVDFRVICFCPPHRIPAQLVSLVHFVIAWEFETIPTGDWTNDISHNWIHMISESKGVITLSNHTRKVFQRGTDKQLRIKNIPVPFAFPHHSLRHQPKKATYIELPISSRNICVDVHGNDFNDIDQAINSLINPTLWDFSTLRLDLTSDILISKALEASYFNKLESWGIWSKTKEPRIFLRRKIAGKCLIKIVIRGIGENVDATVEVKIGQKTHSIVLKDYFIEFDFFAEISCPTNIISFVNATASVQPATGDHRALGIAIKQIEIESHSTDHDRLAFKPKWDRKPFLCPINQNTFFDSGILLRKFHDVESYGVWSAQDHAEIEMPFKIFGKIRIELTIALFSPDETSKITFHFGDIAFEYKVGKYVNVLCFDICTREPFSTIRIAGIKHTSPSNSTDKRILGLALHSIKLISIDNDVGFDSSLDTLTDHTKLHFKPEEVVYVSVLNPADGRKNWRDILTAFAYSLGQRTDATLVLKLTHVDVGPHILEMISEIRRFEKLCARIILLGAFLSPENYSQLVARANFYVNASRGEGFCIPLIEFMGHGVPAISPCHTAMGDYVSWTNCFIVDSCQELAAWPQDASQSYKTLQYRLNWQSLANCFSKSYNCFIEEPLSYARLSAEANSTIKRYCDPDTINIALKEFLNTQ